MCADRFLAGNYPDSPEGLTEKIQSLIDKNQVDGSELFMSDYSAISYDITLITEWNFCGDYQEEIKHGHHRTGIDFGRNYQDFDKHHQNLMNEAQYGTRLRETFVEELMSLNKNALLQYNKNHTFHHYEPFSKTCDCNHCQATGKINCSSCRGKGKKACWSCGGSGSEAYQVQIHDNKGRIRGTQTQYRSCSACFGSGKNKCGDCGGSGKIKCKECSGQGVFTHILKVSAIAKPAYNVFIDDNYALEELQQFLNEKGMVFCAEKINFKLKSYNEVKEDRCQFVYKAQDMEICLIVQLKNKTYQCHAFSSPPYPYIRPAIFDDLFADEWQFLQGSFDEKGNIKKSQAMLFFHKYMEQPALDRALKGMAKRYNAQMAVFYACEGFITDAMSKNIGNALESILQTISPRYSKITWVLFSIPAILIAFIISEYHLQNSHNIIELFIALFVGLFYALIFTILIGILALVVSRSYTYWVNRKIPKEYRLPPFNQIAMRHYLIAVAITFSLGVIYGFLASNGQVPNISPDYYLKLMKIKDIIPR